jgi:sodium transport system permease protein
MLASLLLPGVMIYVLYSLIGNFTDQSQTVADDRVFQVYTLHYPEPFDFMFELFDHEIEVTALSAFNPDDLVRLENRELEMIIVFEPDFYATMQAYTVDSGNPAPHVEVYFNSAHLESRLIYQHTTGLLQAYEQQLSNKFDINRNLDAVYNQATDADFSRQFITGIVPFLLMVFLFGGAQAIATESIAGEKERGTIATLLATPTRRSDIALGKIIALSLTALVGATSSFIGVMFSLPQLINDESFTLAMYGWDTYVLLFVIIITTVLIFVTVLSLISAYAKSIKEAASLATPLMLVVYIVGLTSMLGSSQANVLYYLIPIYNSVQALTAVLNQTITTTQLGLTILGNTILFATAIVILAKAFDSEKIMFNK